jgi:hypothetical protein
MSIDVTQPAALLGADAVTRSWRWLEALRPVRSGARKLNTKTVLGDPDDGLTWTRSRRTLASASVSIRTRTEGSANSADPIRSLRITDRV